MEAGRADASPVVLLHGVGANSMHWRFQLAGLSDRYRVIAWNAPGYVLSDAMKTDSPDCKTFADALNDFLTALKLDRVNLVGNSFGPGGAMLRHPLPRPDHQAGHDRHRDRTARHDNEDKQKIIATREVQIAKGGYAFGARVNALLAANASPETIELVREVVRATSPRGFMHGVKLGMVDGYAPEDVAPKLNFPVLMISGREDRVNPTDKNAAVLIKQLPQGKLEILEETGHLPEVEKPDVVNKMLRDFFG